MAMHGTVSQFNPAKDGWTTYIKHLNHYFITNDVDSEDKKRSILLSACGSSTYKLIQSLVEPGKLDMMPYANIVKLLLRSSSLRNCSSLMRAVRIRQLWHYPGSDAARSPS